MKQQINIQLCYLKKKANFIQNNQNNYGNTKKYINMQKLPMNNNYCNILLTHSKIKKWKHLAYYLTVNNKTQ